MMVSSPLVLVVAAISCCNGLLFPKDSPSRLVKDLNGVWKFKIDDSPGRSDGFDEKWYSKPLSQTIFMPVPSSYNDITQDANIRDFIGWAWYERNFWIPVPWLDGKTRIVLRFESAHYYTVVWVNGVQVMEHEGGHLPFESDITSRLVIDHPNRVTVAVNNTLTPHTLPPGEIKHHGPPNYPEGYFEQEIQFDFYNYAGIQRAVKLYTTPVTFIEDITVTTKLEDDGSANLEYEVMVGQGEATKISCGIELVGASVGATGAVSTHTHVFNGTLHVKSPELWWPWTMSDTPAKLYPLAVNCTDDNTQITDYYRLAIGIREIKVTESQFLINNKPFYMNGVDKHEDWDTIGKGIDYALLIKDINLFKWLGVAAFRTSHYPYAEELLELCDQEGIAVILESPAVGLHNPDNFDDKVLKHHLEVMTEMYNRDKNRPSVVMWSVANEPASNLQVAEAYFSAVVSKTHSLDPYRPVTFACSEQYYTDLACQFMDVIMINQYFAWYSDVGHSELIARQMSNKLDNWHSKFNKPIMVSEYGAGSLSGNHKDPPFLWSEEYQAEVLSNYWPVFDEYRKKYFIGELIWVFADFKTAQGVNRPDGNHKGLFTRQRHPKLAAHLVRQRFMSLAQGRDYHPESVFAK